MSRTTTKPRRCDGGVAPLQPARSAYVSKISSALDSLWRRRHTVIVLLTLLCLVVFGMLSIASSRESAMWPLWFALAVGGIPLVAELSVRLIQREFGSDLLAGISIVTAVLLGEYLAGALVVLMLSGGAAIESFAVRRASSVLNALARRMPSIAHRKTPTGMNDVALDQVRVGDEVLVLPHEICPVDGAVASGRGGMDESYLTGEPYRVSKSVGSEVLSGAINGEAALAITVSRLPVDSRYARIMQVMQHSQQQRPQLRRLGDQLGAIYTPLAMAVAGTVWIATGDPMRFLAVLVVATPCPLLIAIPVAIIGAISLAARRSIIIRDPVALERIASCRTMIFDKTGTLTYGEPRLVEQIVDKSFDRSEVLKLAGSLEQYSKHPLSTAVVEAARQEALDLLSAERIEERPGEGLRGQVGGRLVEITSRKKLLATDPNFEALVPQSRGGLECVVLIDRRYAAAYRFRDEPREEGEQFIGHLSAMHGFEKVLLVSGDRKEEVEYLAERVGISEIHAGKSPEDKLAIVRAETARAPTVFVGDGVNDAPAMTVATVGIAMGGRSEVTTEAASAVIMDAMLSRVDELIHIGSRMRRIALQSAIGGMALSVAGMVFAAVGLLPPVAGAITQEAIDVIAIANALRAAQSPERLTDFRVSNEALSLS